MDLQEINDFLRKALDGYGTSEILEIIAKIKNEQSKQRQLENKHLEAQVTRVIANVVTHSANDIRDIIKTGLIPPHFLY